MKQQVLQQGNIFLKLRRIAIEIMEQNPQVNSFELIGIKERGLVITGIIKAELEKAGKQVTNVSSIELNKSNPLSGPIVLSPGNIDFNNKVIILIDDVANSGRTLFYALKPLLEFSPAKLQLAVLVDRQHKEFPIVPDYVGISLSTTLQEMIMVEIDEKKSTAAVYLH